MNKLKQVSKMAIYDYDIRRVLIASLSNIPEFNNDDTFLINELDVCNGRSRADVAIVNGKLHGFEIKSPQDNLDRLSSQISSYNQVFDTVTLITCDKYLTNARAIIPKWWGIYCINKTKNGLQLKQKRRPKLNIGVSSYQLAGLLWKDELIELICQSTQIQKGLTSKSRNKLALIAAEHISQNIINDYVRSTLKYRQGWKAVPLTQLCDDLHNIQPNFLSCQAVQQDW